MEDETIYSVVKRDDGTGVLSFKCELCDGYQSFNIEYFPKTNLLVCDQCKEDLRALIMFRRKVKADLDKLDKQETINK